MQRIPLVRILACFIPGIILGNNLSRYFIQHTSLLFIILSLCVLALIFTIFIHRIRMLFDILVIPAFILLGICITSLSLISPDTTNEKELIHGTLYQRPVLKENSVLLPLKIRIENNNHFSVRKHYKLNLYTTKDSLLPDLLEPGDKITCCTRLKKIENNHNPDEFNYKQYANCKGIFFTSYSKEEELKFFKKRTLSPEKILFHIQKKCFSVFTDNLTDRDILGVSSALLLGRKDHLSDQLRQNYVDAGAIHVMAVSGLHVGIIYMILSFLLRFMNASRRLIVFQFLIIISFIWFYALLTGLSPSVTRASLMFTFIHLARLTRRDVSLFNTLAFVALLMLFLNPLLLYNVGFQLSFLAVGGIVYYQPRLFNLVKTGNKVVDLITGLLCVTFAAQLVTAPLVLYYFNQFPVYFWLSNLFLTPFIFSALVLSIMLICLSWSPLLSKAVSFLLTQCINITNRGIQYIDHLDHSVIRNINYPAVNILLYFFILILITLWIKRRNAFFLISLLTTIIVAITLNTYKTTKSSPPEITLYNIPKALFLGIYTDQTNNIIFQCDSLQNSKQMEYYFNKHWLTKGIKKNEIIFHPLSQKKSINEGSTLFINNKEIINIISNNQRKTDSQKLSQAPYMLITNPDTFRIPDATKYLVFCPETNNLTRSKWIKKAREKNLKTIDIAKTGAYTIHLK